MEVVHIQKNIGHSPRKMRLVADMVRGQRPLQALATLKFANKAAASDLAAAIKTTLANAKQQGSSGEELVFKTLEVNEGVKIKRFRSAARGRIKRYTRRTSHIRVVLTRQGGQSGAKS